MTSIVQNIIWCVVGVFGGLVIAKLIRKTPPTSHDPQLPQSSLGTKPIKQPMSTQVIDVIQCPNGSAKEAFLANVKNLAPLFEALDKGEKFDETITDAIIEINNNDLMNIWVKICKNPNAVLRILASWGIRREDEVQFKPQKHHFERYKLNNGQSLIEGYNYKVLSPCWIYTFIDNDGATHKEVVIKGVAVEV